MLVVTLSVGTHISDIFDICDICYEIVINCLDIIASLNYYLTFVQSTLMFVMFEAFKNLYLYRNVLLLSFSAFVWILTSPLDPVTILLPFVFQFATFKF